MEAIGTIAADYLERRAHEDADVCLAHCPAELDFMPLSEPLVDVEATLDALEADGLISAAEGVSSARGSQTRFTSAIARWRR